MKKVIYFICCCSIFLLMGCQSHTDRELFNTIKEAKQISATVDNFPSDSAVEYDFNFKEGDLVYMYHISITNKGIHFLQNIEGYKSVAQFYMIKEEHPEVYKRFVSLLISEDMVK